MASDVETVENKPQDEETARSLGKLSEKLSGTLKSRFTAATDYWGTRYDDAKEDVKFFAGDQWPQIYKNQRNLPGKERPTLTINRLPQFHSQIVNDYRQATIGLKAVPQESHDIDTAKAYQGIFRQIEKHSFAQLAYIKALSDGSLQGLGYIRVTTGYLSDDSFNQDIFIQRVVRPFAHFPDPKATGFFLEDANWWIVLHKTSKEELEEDYGDKEYTSFDALSGEEKDTGEDIIIAEYFYYTTKNRVLCLFKDSSSLWEDEIDTKHPDYKSEHVIRRRTVKARTLCWILTDGTHVLEKNEWPTTRIPIVPVWGNELWIDDKRESTGFVRNAKDSCRMYNYFKSAEAEAIALAPKAPYIAEEGQLEGRTEEWNNAASTPKSVLLYKGVAIDGHIVGPPQRQTYEAPINALVTAGIQASEDMKATIGMYDASLGQRSNEVSGKAIDARKREGDVATYNFVDNLSLAIGYLGLIVGELIPIIYDNERIQRIIGDDGKVDNIVINKKDENGQPVEKSPQIVDIKYDLVLDTGPSFQTQRQETAQTIVDLAHNYPQLMELAGDIAIGSMNFQGAQEIAARLKRAIPPAVVGDDEDAETKLAAATQQLEQGKQIVTELTSKIGELEHTNADLQLKLVSKNGELNIREQEVELKRDEVKLKLMETEAKIEQLKSQTKNGDLTVEGLAAMAEALIDHGSHLETLQNMLMGMVAEPAPAAAPEGAEAGEGVAPAASQPAPASDATAAPSEPAQ